MPNNQEIARFIAYINAIITNTAKNCYKKEYRIIVNEVSIDDVSEVSLSRSSDEDAFFNALNDNKQLEYIFTEKKHYEAMKKLSDREKLVLKLTILEEMTAKDIAKTINITEQAVWNIKSRAINSFLNNLGEE